ncbi:MAG: redoxin domain-containing protein [Planctomycetota bacterium]
MTMRQNRTRRSLALACEFNLGSALLIAALTVALVGVDARGEEAKGKGKTQVKYQSPEQLRPVQEVGEGQPAIRPADLKGPKPIVKVNSDTHDFGSVWVGPDLNHTYKLTNDGDAPLLIDKVKPSCGCTVAGPYPKQIAPGESGDFPFAMKSDKLRGTFQKNITIESNDPINPRLRLTLRGEVKRFVDITPASASFGRITEQEPQTRELTIINNTETPVQLTLQKEPNDPFAYELVEKEAGKRYSLNVTAKPPFTEGSLHGNLRIGTNVEQQKELMVASVATVPPRLEVQPTAVIVAKARPDAPPTSPEGLSRVLRFTNYGKEKVKLVEAKCDDPSVAVSVRERTEGQAYTIEVQMPAGYQPPGEGRMITLKTDDAKTPEIKIPIRGTDTGPTVTAENVAPKPAPLIGTAAPSFNLTTLEGKPLNNDALKGTVAVLDFFAPNCGFCKKQIPRIEPIRAQYADKGVRFVNVSQKMGKEFSQEEIVDILKGLGSRSEVALNHDNTVGQMFGATGFPTMVVIGKDGKVAAINTGNIADLETRMTGQLDALLAGKPVPTDTMAAAPATPPAVDKAKPADQPALPSPKAPAAATDGAPKPAPKFALKTVGTEKDVSNATLADSAATVLDFFAVNCGYCGKQIPRLETIRKEYESKGVRFVAVQETMRQEMDEQQAAAKLKEFGWGGEWARDPKNEFGPPFGASGFPTMVVLGKSGKIEATNVGNIADLETRLKGQLDALIAGKPIPAEFAAAPKPQQRATPDQMAGKPAPAMTLTTTEGKSVANGDFGNYTATVLNFFAPNCGFCKKQIPRLETVRKEFDGKPVRFVNVSMTMGKEFAQDETMNILKEIGWAGEVARDPKNEVGPKFNVSGFPTMMIVGKDGKVQAANVGNIDDLESKVKGQLESLIAGKDLATAPAAAPGGGPQAAPAVDPQAAAQPAAPPPAKKRPAEDFVGQAAPAFTLSTTAGKPLSSEEFAKRPATVLNFVAPTCGYCKKQVPNVDKVRAEYEAKGVRFVNVVEAMGGKESTVEEITNVFKQAGSNLELAKDDGNKIGQLYKAVSYPTMFVVGKDGKVAHVNIGAKQDIEQMLKGQLDGLLTKTN